MNLKSIWKTAWKENTFAAQFLLTLIFLLIIGSVASVFFEYIQLRKGLVINDIVLKAIPAKDVSVIIFTIIYLSLLLALGDLIFFPKDLLIALQAYLVLSLFRIACIYFIKLDPPAEIVALKDPFASYFFYNQKPIDKDLFFSGHTSMMVLLVLVCKNKSLKIYQLASMIMIGSLILIQHVHYSLDVFAAPVFAFISLAIVKKLH